MAGTCGKAGGQQSSDASAVWQTRRKKEERKFRCGGLERDRSEEMEGLRDWIGMSGRGYLRRPRSF
jgi:hypothetical protein